MTKLSVLYIISYIFIFNIHALARLEYQNFGSVTSLWPTRSVSWSGRWYIVHIYVYIYLLSVHIYLSLLFDYSTSKNLNTNCIIWIFESHSRCDHFRRAKKIFLSTGCRKNCIFTIYTASWTVEMRCVCRVGRCCCDCRLTVYVESAAVVATVDEMCM